VPGVDDGGANRAAGNGNPSHCTGVRCASDVGNHPFTGHRAFHRGLPRT
jgi:hypothetical protein